MEFPMNPGAPIMAQLRAAGLPEHLPLGESMVYRFRDSDGALLYVGVTMSPRGRWQAHKRSAAWWTDVSTVSVTIYPHERAALDAEVEAIRTESPEFNRRSSLMHPSCGAHEESLSSARAILPRVGGGVGVGEGDGCGAIHASRLTSGFGSNSRPVDNATAATTRDRLAWMALREIGGGW